MSRRGIEWPTSHPRSPRLAIALPNDNTSQTHRVRDEPIRVLFHNNLHISGHFHLDIETVSWWTIAHSGHVDEVYKGRGSQIWESGKLLFLPTKLPCGMCCANYSGSEKGNKRR